MTPDTVEDVSPLLEDGLSPEPPRGGMRRPWAIGVSALLLGSAGIYKATSSPLSTFLNVDGLVRMEEEEPLTFWNGEFISPTEKPTLCWATDSNNKLILKDCETEPSDNQHFEYRNYSNIVHNDLCLDTNEDGTAVFKECADGAASQMWQFPQRGGSFGGIANCACTQAACPASCEDAKFLVKDGDQVRTGPNQTDWDWYFASGDGDDDDDDDGASAECVENGQDCSKSKCCSEPGMSCFKKNDHWASCNLTCSENWKWNHDTWRWEEQDEKVWDCELLSDPVGCSDNGDDCSKTKCCNSWDSRCFRKNDHWASCNKTCDSNYKWVDDKWAKQDDKVWDCDVLSCTHNGEDCSLSKCCLDPNARCFKKNDHWSSCNSTCDPYMKWEDGQWQKKDEPVWDCGVVSPTYNGESCLTSKSCVDPESKCYKKNEHWASCNKTCDPYMLWNVNKWEKQDEKVWDCEVLS